MNDYGNVGFLDGFTLSWGEVAPVFLPLAALAVASLGYVWWVVYGNTNLKIFFDDLGDMFW
tara:strand:- start:40 stop:222 length:183 start_codon:yes stop_codon:yes gene_type:complete